MVASLVEIKCHVFYLWITIVIIFVVMLYNRNVPRTCYKLCICFLFKCLLQTRGPNIITWKIKNDIYTVIKYLYKYYKIKK